MRKVLVTGASGFVGQVLCQQLAERSISVKAAVRKPGEYFAFSKDSFTQIQVGDIGPSTDWSTALNGVEVIFHLAARVHVMRENAIDPLAEFRSVNTIGTEYLARAAAAQGVKRLVYVSSIKVNGEKTLKGIPYTELVMPQPEDMYGISKLEAEQVLHQIAQETGLEVVIVRSPLIYGPNVKANFFKLLKIVDHSIPLPIGSIQNTRSIIYVANLVDALIKCATHPTASGKTYLVSDGEDISTSQLVKKLADLLDRPCHIFSFPIVLMQSMAALIGKSATIDKLTQSLVIDSSKIRKELDWQPPYTMGQGLRATTEWYLQLIRSRKA